MTGKKCMINWLLFQSLIASVILIVLMIGKPFALRFMGAKVYYFLWALMPLSMLMGLVPNLQQSNSSISYYLVSLKKASNEIGSSFGELSDGIIVFWFLGILFFLCKLIIVHRQHLNSLHLHPIDHQNTNFHLYKHC